jgi:hypothetical protein
MFRIHTGLLILGTYFFSQICFSNEEFKDVHVNFEVQAFDEISGTSDSEHSSKKLLFYAKSSSDRVAISFSIDHKKWTTHLNLKSEKIEVLADGFTLSNEDRSILQATSMEVQRTLTSELTDYAHAQLLIQFLGYWSKSPEGYLVQSQKLGN